MDKKIAIVAVAYNRVNSLARLLSSISDANYKTSENIHLIISIDKSDTDEVENYAEEYLWSHGVKIVDKHPANLGLRNHMMSLGKWFKKYDALIVLEDDLIVAKDFYNYARQMVSKYSEDSRIAGVSLYSFKLNYLNNQPFEPAYDGNDVYFMNCAMSWGEIWMRDQWNEFYEWYLTHDDFPIMSHLPLRLCMMGKKSWLKYHTRYCIEQDKFFVFPYHSLSTNFSDIGTHNSGLHYSQYQVPLSDGIGVTYRLPELDSSSVVYDGFFENISIYNSLGFNKSELCIDLNGTRSDIPNERYWLTTQIRDLKIVSIFKDELRPIEQNVLKKRNTSVGGAIFLYDTTQEQKNKHKSNIHLYRYYLGDIIPFLRVYGELRVVKEYCRHYLKRLIR